MDPEILNSLLGSSDLDVNDPIVQAALAQLIGGSKPDEKVSRKRKSEDEGKDV